MEGVAAGAIDVWGGLLALPSMAADPLWPRLAAAVEIARETGRSADGGLAGEGSTATEGL
jgi:hypothetical protein